MNSFKRIGVFDSGLGGLTVLDAICSANKGLSIVYFGDTARVPYGSRTPETIIHYAEQDVRFLLSKGVEAIVVACGTVSAIALDELRKEFSVPRLVDIALKPKPIVNGHFVSRICVLWHVM